MLIEKLKLKLETKKNIKNLSLITSKENYIDPRILIAFLKKMSIPIDNFFTKKFQEKFKWAFDIDKNFVF